MRLLFFFIYLLYIAKLLTKIYNTLHYLYYSRYLQHSTTLRFLSLLQTHNEKKKERNKRKGKGRTTYYICALVTYKNKVEITKIVVLTYKPLKQTCNYRVEFNVCCSLHISVHKETQISKNMFENKTKTS